MGPRRPRISRAASASSREECRKRAFRLLSIRSRSREELRRALELRGHESGAIAETLDSLERGGLLNDQAALEAFLLDREDRFGKERLRHELRRRGFPAESIDRALAEISEDDERALAETLLRRRWDELSKLSPEKRKKRVFDFLNRRGFPTSLIFDLLGEEGDS
ncbi:MAG: regulatory protein RecX [Thermoanaerobaculia bacterium]